MTVIVPEPTVCQRLEARRIWAESYGNWVPANGGTETPFVSRSGRRLLYCWQPVTGRHAYLDCDSDVILSDAEAAAFMQMA